jgi:dTDP-4-dehydrorhamnose reductase
VILVFGGNGQLGRELTRAAASRALALRALSRAEVDIADAAAVAAALGRWNPEIVINAAAYTKVDLAESNIAEVSLANETGPAVLAEACAAARVPLLHISTDYVFDGTKQGAYVEADPAHPLNVYGRTKAAGEEAVRRTLAHHLILRTAWLYSEFGDNFLKTMLRLATTREELRVVADQYGSPTSAREIAAAILLIAPSLVSASNLSGTYHFAAGGLTTWHGFASRIVATAAPLTGRHPRVTPIRTVEYPTAAERPANSQLDCQLFAQTFGLTPRHWTEGVDATTRALLASSHAAESHVA